MPTTAFPCDALTLHPVKLIFNQVKIITDAFCLATRVSH